MDRIWTGLNLQQSCRANAQQHFPYKTCLVWVGLQLVMVNILTGNKKLKILGLLSHVVECSVMRILKNFLQKTCSTEV